MLRPSTHHGCGACHDGWGRFFAWGQPLRHLFLKNTITTTKPARVRKFAQADAKRGL